MPYITVDGAGRFTAIQATAACHARSDCGARTDKVTRPARVIPALSVARLLHGDKSIRRVGQRAADYTNIRTFHKCKAMKT